MVRKDALGQGVVGNAILKKQPEQFQGCDMYITKDRTCPPPLISQKNGGNEKKTKYQTKRLKIYEPFKTGRTKLKSKAQTKRLLAMNRTDGCECVCV